MKEMAGLEEAVRRFTSRQQHCRLVFQPLQCLFTPQASWKKEFRRRFFAGLAFRIRTREYPGRAGVVRCSSVLLE